MNRNSSINVAFFGTSDRSIPVLDAIKNDPDLNLVLAITKSDVKVGRKQELKETGVKKWSKENKINFFTTSSLKYDKLRVVEQLLDSKVALGIVTDFSFIIQEEIINTPKYGIINIHFSLLPNWRGASPVQFAILNGDQITGITYHLVSKEMDRGDILFSIEYKIPDKPDSNQLNDSLFKIAAQNLPEIIKKYIRGDLVPKSQNESEATYTYSPTHPKSTFIYKEDAKINWRDSVDKIERTIRAFYPWPVAWTTLGELGQALNITLREGKHLNLKVKVHTAEVTNLGGQSKLKINKLQVEGGKTMSWEEFINGYSA